MGIVDTKMQSGSGLPLALSIKLPDFVINHKFSNQIPRNIPKKLS